MLIRGWLESGVDREPPRRVGMREAE